MFEWLSSLFGVEKEKTIEYLIVDKSNRKILERHKTPKQAQRAQKKWHALWLWHDGPETYVTTYDWRGQ